MAANVERTLEAMGVEFKSVEIDHFGLPCVVCGHEGTKLTIHKESGLWDCKVCGAKGNLYQLAEKVKGKAFATSVVFGRGDKGGGVADAVAKVTGGAPPPKPKLVQHAGEALSAVSGDAGPSKTLDPKLIDAARSRLMEDDVAMEYLRTARGFSLDAVTHFRLGVRVVNGVRWIVVPHLDAAGAIVNVKFRTVPPAKKAFERQKGCRSILFNEAAIEDAEEVFVCEGEMDAIALWDLGWKNVVSVTAGAGALLPAWVDRLSQAKRIVLVFDRDEAGRRGAWERARQLGLDRTWTVSLPEDVKDVNDLLVARGREEGKAAFEACAAAAKQFDIERVETVEESLLTLKYELAFGEGGEETFVTWGPFNGIRKLIGDPRPGDNVLLCAEPKTGKTTLSILVAAYNALAGIPALLICQEMSTVELVRKLVQAHHGVAPETMTLDHVNGTLDKFRFAPLFLAYVPELGVSRAGEFFAMVRDAVRRYALHLVIHDNVHTLIRDSRDTERDSAAISKGIKDLAMREQFAFMPIVQTTKLKQGEKARPRNMKYTGAWYADADRMLFLHRPESAGGSALTLDEDGVVGGGSKSPLCEVYGEGRFSDGGVAYLVFEGWCSRFRTPEPDEINALLTAAGL